MNTLDFVLSYKQRAMIDEGRHWVESTDFKGCLGAMQFLIYANGGFNASI